MESKDLHKPDTLVVSLWRRQRADARLIEVVQSTFDRVIIRKYLVCTIMHGIRTLPSHHGLRMPQGGIGTYYCGMHHVLPTPGGVMLLTCICVPLQNLYPALDRWLVPESGGQTTIIK
jgi:hypothetical protein